MKTLSLPRISYKFISSSPLLLATHLTFFLLIFHFPSDWYLNIPIALWGMTVVLEDRAFFRPFTWQLASLFIFIYLFYHWEDADNHHYVIGYVCLLLALALKKSSEVGEQILRENSRLLLGLIMLFSVIWKIISPTFLTGAFFHYTLLVDDRFHIMTSLLTLTPIESLQENINLLGDITKGHLSGDHFNSVVLQTHQGIKRLAFFLTWWTVGIESLLALSFLWKNSFLFKLRFYLLVLFALTTYSVASVSGFAWILLILALAQSQYPQDKWARFFLLLCFPLVEIFRSPMGAIAAHFIRALN